MPEITEESIEEAIEPEIKPKEEPIKTKLAINPLDTPPKKPTKKEAAPFNGLDLGPILEKMDALGASIAELHPKKKEHKKDFIEELGELL